MSNTKAGVKPVMTEPPTRAAFLAALRSLLVERYEWAKQPARLAVYMTSARFAVMGGKSQWQHSGPVSQEAFNRIGCMGKVTLAALQRLPAGTLEDAS